MPATRAQLRTMAQLRADHDDSDFPTTTQFDFYIDAAARRVFGDLLAAGWRPSLSSVTVTGTGVQTYTLGLAMDVYGIHGVYGPEGYALRRANEGSRAGLMLSASGRATDYCLVVDMTTGPGIELLPKPSGGAYRVEYIPDFPGFANDAAVWRGPARSDDLISLDAARQAVLKEGRTADGNALAAEYAEKLMQVAEHASRYDMRNPPMIRDESRRAIGDGSDYDVSMTPWDGY
jgi:hypothetical protein